MNDLQKKLKAIGAAMAAWDALRSNVRGVSADDLLGRVGLERRRGLLDRAIPWLGGFGTGMVVGTAMGLLMAPMSGAELREKLVTDPGKVWEAIFGLGGHADDRPEGFDTGNERPGAQA